MTLDDDLRAAEEHRRRIELLNATNPKVERVRARAQVKAARAESQNYQVARGVGMVAAAIAAILLGISGCSAVVYGPGDDQMNMEKDRLHNEMFKACIEAGGSWDDSQEDCDQ